MASADLACHCSAHASGYEINFILNKCDYYEYFKKGRGDFCHPVTVVSTIVTNALSSADRIPQKQADIRELFLPAALLTVRH